LEKSLGETKENLIFEAEISHSQSENLPKYIEELLPGTLKKKHFGKNLQK